MALTFISIPWLSETVKMVKLFLIVLFLRPLSFQNVTKEEQGANQRLDYFLCVMRCWGNIVKLLCFNAWFYMWVYGLCITFWCRQPYLHNKLLCAFSSNLVDMFTMTRGWTLLILEVKVIGEYWSLRGCYALHCHWSVSTRIWPSDKLVIKWFVNLWIKMQSF